MTMAFRRAAVAATLSVLMVLSAPSLADAMGAGAWSTGVASKSPGRSGPGHDADPHQDHAVPGHEHPGDDLVGPAYEPGYSPLREIEAEARLAGRALQAPSIRPLTAPARGMFHVATTGDDVNDGSPGKPWRTISKATSVATAGDTVLVHAGTYRESVSFANSGTGETARIVLQAAPGERVVLDGSSGRLTGWTAESNRVFSKPVADYVRGVFQDSYETVGKHASLWYMDLPGVYGSNPNSVLHDFDPAHDYYGGQQSPEFIMHDWRSQWSYQNGVLRITTSDGQSPDQHDVRAVVIRTAFYFKDRDYISVEGIEVRNYYELAAVENSQTIRLKGLDARYFSGGTIWVTYGSEGFELLDSLVWGSGSWMGHYQDIINGRDSAKGRIEGSDLAFGGHANIVVLDQGDDWVYRGNHVHDSGGSLLIIKRDTDRALIEGNVFARAPYQAETRAHKTPHAALQLSGEDHVYRRNILADNGVGLSISCSDTQVQMRGKFYHNTILGTEYNAVILGGYDAAYSANMRDNVFKNNIFVGATGHTVWLDIPGGESSNYWDNHFENNLFDGVPLWLWNAGEPSIGEAEAKFPAVFSKNVAADPMFVDAANYDLHLKNGSAAIDRGVDVGLPFNGSAPDMGRWEHGTGGGGGGNNTAPAPPAVAGPTSGFIGDILLFTSTATDPEGDQVKHTLDWGDGSSDTSGFVSSGASASLSHSWASAGTFLVKAMATDAKGAASAWSPQVAVSISSRPANNSAPEVPVFSGPLAGLVGQPLDYSINGSDPDGDDLQYTLDWGDGTNHVSKMRPSGTALVLTHAWSSPGSFQLVARSTDSRGANSSWGVPRQVTISTNGSGGNTSDTMPPVISHEPVLQATAGEAVYIAAQVTDDRALALVELSFRPVGGIWTTLRMDPVGGAAFAALIPGDEVVAGRLEYFLEAVDSSGNRARDPVAGAGDPHVIEVRSKTGDGGGGMGGAGGSFLGVTALLILLVSAILAGTVVAALAMRRKKRGRAPTGASPRTSSSLAPAEPPGRDDPSEWWVEPEQ